MEFHIFGVRIRSIQSFRSKITIFRFQYGTLSTRAASPGLRPLDSVEGIQFYFRGIVSRFLLTESESETERELVEGTKESGGNETDESRCEKRMVYRNV